VLAETEGKIYGAIAIDGPEDLVPPFPDAVFPFLIWDHDGHFTDAQRSAVARTLLEAGCRFAVYGGQSCEAWHDAVDIEFMQKPLDDPEELLEAMHVMTTWHPGESPDDVASFFVLTNCYRKSHHLLFSHRLSPLTELYPNLPIRTPHYEYCCIAARTSAFPKSSSRRLRLTQLKGHP
jgi:hypothetical protein